MLELRHRIEADADADEAAKQHHAALAVYVRQFWFPGDVTLTFTFGRCRHPSMHCRRDLGPQALRPTPLAGNHLLIESADAVIAMCHLQQCSVVVHPGQRVHRGEMVARCGNSGNSTEPHVHLQAIDGRDVNRAHAVPLTFRGGLPRNGEIVDMRENRTG